MSVGRYVTAAALVVAASTASACATGTAPPATGPQIGVSIPAPLPKPVFTSGAEGPSDGNHPACTLVTPAQAAKAFQGVVSSAAASTSPLGNPLCVLRLTQTGLGPTVTVSVSVSKLSRTQFRANRTRHPVAQLLPALGVDSYFDPASGAVQVMHGAVALVVQATTSARSSTQFAAGLRARSIALSTVIVAQI